MRAVVLSYSHHGRGLATAAHELGHDIVGAMDREEAPRRELAEVFDCPAYGSPEDCLDEARPDVALVSGKHTEIAGHLQACVERGIPYIVDKPFADSAARLRPVAAATEKQGLFSALTLSNRRSRLVPLVMDMLDDGRLGDLVLFGSRLNNGPPSRYDSSHSYWHNDPAISGGGSFAVEAAHGIDTFLQAVNNADVQAVGGVMSNAMFGRPFEDWGMGILRTADGVTGVVEAGYTYPVGQFAGDHFFRFVGTRGMVFERYDRQHRPVIEVHTSAGVEFLDDSTNRERFPAIIDDAFKALAAGDSFEPAIGQAVRILEAQDAVYAIARANPAANGPHPMAPPATPPA